MHSTFTASSVLAPRTASKRQVFGDVIDDHHERNTHKRQRLETTANDNDLAKSHHDNQMPESSTDSESSSVLDLDSFCSSYYNFQMSGGDTPSSYFKYQSYDDDAPLPKIPRREGYRTITPLYKKFLKRRLLGETNVWFYPCCWNECSGKWNRNRPSVKQMMKDYHPSDLSTTQYSWGQWRQTNH